jgi:hypothetical protein
VQPAPTDAPHYYNHVFIMEQLDKFVENPFDGEVASLSIPPEVISQATTVVQEMREDSVEINTLTIELNDLDGRMKTTSSRFVIRQLEDSYKDVNRALTLIRNRRLHFHTDLDDIVRKICLEHQSKVTGYDDLVKGHIDNLHSKRSTERKLRRRMFLLL